MRGVIVKRSAAFLVIACFLALFPSRASAAENLIVLFPSAREPFKTAYEQIISGISSPGVRVHTLELNGKEPAEELRARIKNKAPRAIIALGRVAEQAARRANTGLPLYTGATLLIPGDRDSAGVSLELSPAHTLGQFMEIFPHIKKIYYVHQPGAAPVTPFYVRAAKDLGLAFEPQQVSSALDAATTLNALAETAERAAEAVWLSGDVTKLNPSVLLPLMQDLMWEKYLLMVSSNPNDVKEGVPIGFYPDYVAMGNALRELTLSGRATTLFAPAAKLAVNYRMAKHLGLRLDDRRLGGFDTVFGR